MAVYLQLLKSQYEWRILEGTQINEIIDVSTIYQNSLCMCFNLNFRHLVENVSAFLEKFSAAPPVFQSYIVQET